MSPVLVVVTDTDASIFGWMATNFRTRNSGVLLQMSCRWSLLVSASKRLCNTVRKSNSSMHSEIIATRQDAMRTMRLYMGSIPLRNLSVNDAPSSSSPARLSKTPN